VSNTVAPGGALGKDAFLQLMVTQMKYQDPLQPQDNSQFLAQLAQFTALEQMTNIAQTNESVALYLKLSFEHQLIGRTVEVDTGHGQTVSGVVKGIKMVDGDPQLIIDDATYPLSAVTQME
jgi:flagellar basal-body rod modification protein FlgD